METTLVPGGLLIAVEGIDGAGKTTLAHTLGDKLRAKGIAVSVSKEPTSGPWGAQLRASAAAGRLDATEEMRLLILDRRQHVDEVIRPALSVGKIVILDRYYPSSVAYQGARGISTSEILLQNAFAPPPDVTLVLDLDPIEGLSRIHARGDKPNHFETAENLAHCRDIFLTMKLPSRVVLDAATSPGEVISQAWRAILRTMADKLTGKSGLSVENGERLLALGAAM